MINKLTKITFILKVVYEAVILCKFYISLFKNYAYNVNLDIRCIECLRYITYMIINMINMISCIYGLDWI